MSNEKKAALALIIGASGSGKSSVCDELEKIYGLKAIPSYTTREPRTPDEKGHTFISDCEFDNLKDILAYAETDGNRYAVTKEMLEDEQYSLYVIDLSGVKYLLEHYKGDRPLVSFFIDTNVYDRFKRMIDRKDDRTPIDKMKAALDRIEHDAVEFNRTEVLKYVNFIVGNPDGKFDSTIAYIKRICDLYGIGGGERIKE